MKGYMRSRGVDSYEISIHLGYLPDGTRKTYRETFRGKKREAENRCSTLVARFNAGELGESIKLTLAEYLEQWLTECVRNSVQPRTYTGYRYIVESRITPSIGHIKLSKLSPFNVQSFYNDLKDAKKLSSQTILHIHRVLSRALDQAVKWNYIHRNVSKLADRPPLKKKEMLAMSSAQAKAFIEAARTDRYFCLWHFALDTGTRPEEYFALKWSDVNFEQGSASVQRALCWNKTHAGGWYFGPPKSEKSRRVIYFSQATLELLKKHRKQQLEEKIKAEVWHDLDLIFCSSTGNPLLLANLTKRSFKPILERAGLSSKFRVYDLRHSMATIMLEGNANLKIVQERLGHSSITLTGDTYSHVNPSMQRQGRDILEGEIFNDS